MDNNEMMEIKELSDTDLLSLYDKVLEHLEYLKSNLITNSFDGGESNNG